MRVVNLCDVEDVLATVAKVAQRSRHELDPDDDSDEAMVKTAIYETEDMVVAILTEHARRMSYRVRIR